MAKRMKSAFAGLVVALGAASAATGVMADGMPAGKMAAPAPAMSSAFNWSGFFVGGNIGGAWSDASYSVNAVGFPAATEAFDTSSFIGGVQAIYQGQWGNLVVGVEAGLTGGSFEDSRVSTNFANRTFQSDIDTIFTLTPRLGYAANNWLLYVKAGYANADISRATYTTTTGAQRNGGSHREDGWVVGGGLEMAVSSNVTLGLDYSYLQFDVPNRNNGISQVDFVGGGTRFLSHDADIHMLTARINFKLGH